MNPATATVTADDATLYRVPDLNTAVKAQVEEMIRDVAAATGATPEAVAAAAEVTITRCPELFTVTITLTYLC